MRPASLMLRLVSRQPLFANAGRRGFTGPRVEALHTCVATPNTTGNVYQQQQQQRRGLSRSMVGRAECAEESPRNGSTQTGNGGGLSREAAQILATRSTVRVRDSYISYLDSGYQHEHGKVVVFLHGNPTQAYLWRDVIPHVTPVARCVAPDLIGMGQSGKIKSEYFFEEHYAYLCAWLDSMNLGDKLHFVVHDWGSALGLHWCHQHAARVHSITVMEAILAPIAWSVFGERLEEVFRDLRSERGDYMILQDNLILEDLLPLGVLRELDAREKNVYLAPYRQPGERRRPMLTWARELPIIGEGPERIVRMVDSYARWLRCTGWQEGENGSGSDSTASGSVLTGDSTFTGSTKNESVPIFPSGLAFSSAHIPRLYIHAQPGFFSDSLREEIAQWPNTRTVTVRGHHILQEDSPHEIGVAVRDFVRDIN